MKTPPHQKKINLRKAALQKFNKEQTTINLIEYKLHRVKAYKRLKETKKECWWGYVNKSNISIKPKTFWEND